MECTFNSTLSCSSFGLYYTRPGSYRMECTFTPKSMLSFSSLGLYYTRPKDGMYVHTPYHVIMLIPWFVLHETRFLQNGMYVQTQKHVIILISWFVLHEIEGWNVHSNPIACYHAHLLVCITRDRRMECTFKPKSMLSFSSLGLYYTRPKDGMYIQTQKHVIMLISWFVLHETEGWNVHSNPKACYHSHLLVCITRDRRMECTFKPSSTFSCSFLGLYYTRPKNGMYVQTQ